MNFESEDQAKAYMAAEAEGELEMQAAHDAAVAEMETEVTDLEIIKANEPFDEDFEGYKCKPNLDKWRKVLEVTERMAKEIESQKAIIDSYKIEDDRALKFLEGTSREEIIRIASHNMIKFLEEIDRLKTELAERPKVVYCKDCKWLDTVTCPRSEWSAEHQKKITATEKDDFCKYGECRNE